jgi:hypothetical protein
MLERTLAAAIMLQRTLAAAIMLDRALAGAGGRTFEHDRRG